MPCPVLCVTDVRRLDISPENVQKAGAPVLYVTGKEKSCLLLIHLYVKFVFYTGVIEPDTLLETALNRILMIKKILEAAEEAKKI